MEKLSNGDDWDYYAYPKTLFINDDDDSQKRVIYNEILVLWVQLMINVMSGN